MVCFCLNAFSLDFCFYHNKNTKIIINLVPLQFFLNTFSSGPNRYDESTYTNEILKSNYKSIGKMNSILWKLHRFNLCRWRAILKVDPGQVRTRQSVVFFNHLQIFDIFNYYIYTSYKIFIQHNSLTIKLWII